MHLDELVKTIPKAELHVHLEGAIPPITALNLAHKYSHLGVVEKIESLQELVTFQNFEDFHSYYQLCMQLIRSAEDFALVVYESGRDMMNQNIRYREMYISIYQHLHVWEKNLRYQDVLDVITIGRQKALEDFGVEMQWIFGISCNRHLSGHPRKGNLCARSLKRIFDPTDEEYPSIFG